jgi:hypothetical protein
MPKAPNTIETVQITISTTRPVQMLLERLVLTGLYGKNPAEAAERLLARSLEALTREGSLRLTEA